MLKRIGASVSLLISFAAGVMGAQSAPKKDIPTIAKAANGAIVTIVMANDDKPIARGTGFLVSPAGVIVTNYHVIANGNVAVVKFSDDVVLPVDGVLAADKTRDLAIIKVHGKEFRALPLGNSDRLQIGEDVVAIGNPLGLELTVSNGILSGVRMVEKEGGKFLQVTAPISHGSSGGPLFNMAGEVIGITSMYFEGGENLNFAIPVNDAKILLRQQSAVMRGLPNEPEESEATAPPRTTATKIDEMDQRWCSEVSEKYFHYRVSDFNHVKYAFKAGYGSNIISVNTLSNVPTKRCFIEIVVDYGMGKNPSTNQNSFSVSGHRYFVEDATFEGDGAPSYGSYSDGGTEGSCNITPTERSPIKCRSEEEFDELAGKYFGLLKPRATSLVLPSGTPSVVNSTLPPNTKMSAGPDPAKYSDEQTFEDLRYCTQYPDDNLQVPNGEQLRCRDLMAAIEAQSAHCKTAPDSKTAACKNVVAWFTALRQ